jgi:pimeloyl-ACP methyl ester carboxylesterase
LTAQLTALSAGLGPVLEQTMPRIDIGRITLNYAEAGDGEPLLFIPGLVGVHDAWDFQLAHF